MTLAFLPCTHAIISSLVLCLMIYGLPCTRKLQGIHGYQFVPTVYAAQNPWLSVCANCVCTPSWTSQYQNFSPMADTAHHIPTIGCCSAYANCSTCATSSASQIQINTKHCYPCSHASYTFITLALSQQLSCLMPSFCADSKWLCNFLNNQWLMMPSFCTDSKWLCNFVTNWWLIAPPNTSLLISYCLHALSGR
jgi:hypothetical protein